MLILHHLTLLHFGFAAGPTYFPAQSNSNISLFAFAQQSYATMVTICANHLMLFSDYNVSIILILCVTVTAAGGGW